MVRPRYPFRKRKTSLSNLLTILATPNALACLGVANFGLIDGRDDKISSDDPYDRFKFSHENAQAVAAIKVEALNAMFDAVKLRDNYRLQLLLGTFKKRLLEKRELEKWLGSRNFFYEFDGLFANSAGGKKYELDSGLLDFQSWRGDLSPVLMDTVPRRPPNGFCSSFTPPRFLPKTLRAPTINHLKIKQPILIIIIVAS